MKQLVFFLVLFVVNSLNAQNKKMEALIVKANSGNPKSQCELAEEYFSESNYEKAVFWFRKAAEQNFTSAQVSLGICYQKGLGVPKDPASAVSWYRPAVIAGNSLAMYNLACCYYNGEGVSKNTEEALALFKKSADNYNVAASFYGSVLLEGKFVKADTLEALRYLHYAAEHHNEDAYKKLYDLENVRTQFRYVILYYIADIMRLNEQYVDAESFFKESINEGSIAAMEGLGFLYDSFDNREKSFLRDQKNPQWRDLYKLNRSENDNAPFWWSKYIEESAEEDTSMSYLLCRIGYAYARGFGTPIDYHKALYWFRRYMNSKSPKESFFAGEVEDEIFLADLYYESGEDFKKAFEMYKTLTQDNKMDGLISDVFNKGMPYVGLGKCYYYGNGTGKNYALAAKNFEIAANEGNIEGMIFLAKCYQEGKGKQKNVQLAKKWQDKANELTAE